MITVETQRHNKREERRMRRFLQRAPDGIADGVKLAFLESAKAVQRDAISMATSSRVKRALGFKRAIGVKLKGLRVDFGIRTKAQKKLAWFGVFLELGTKPHSLASKNRAGGLHPGTAAQPFLFPAVEKNREANRRRMSESFDEAVKKALKLV